MPVVGNRIKVASSSTGTGNITLGSAEDGYQTFASGGISNNDVVRYVITEGSAWEIGKGTYLTSGPTLTRTSGNLLESSTGSLLNLSGSATVFVSLADVDVMQTDGGTFSGDIDVIGNITVSGTVDNVDIAARDGVLTSTTTTANAAMPKAGGTFTGDVTFEGSTVDITFDQSLNALQFADFARCYFGNSYDLTIEHNSTSNHSRIWNTTGNISIVNFDNDKDIAIETDNGSGGTTNYFVADGSTGEVRLYHYGSQKLATKSTGIDVTGNIAFEGLTADAFETTLDVIDPTQDNTLNLPNESGTIATRAHAVALALVLG